MGKLLAQRNAYVISLVPQPQRLHGDRQHCRYFWRHVFWCNYRKNTIDFEYGANHEAGSYRFLSWPKVNTYAIRLQATFQLFYVEFFVKWHGSTRDNTSFAPRRSCGANASQVTERRYQHRGRCPGLLRCYITPQVFGQLDLREKNGYLRLCTDIHFDDGSSLKGLVYIARQDNAAFLGAASELEIARQIALSAGPSGPNRAYLDELAAALRELGKNDAHVFTIEQYLAEL